MTWALYKFEWVVNRVKLRVKTYTVLIQAPTEMERGEIIHGLLESENVSADVSISHIAQRTAVSNVFSLSPFTVLFLPSNNVSLF